MLKLTPKPCPICGNKRTTMYEVIYPSGLFAKKYHVECDYCNFCAKDTRTKRGAVRLWNKSTNVVSVKERIGDDDA